MAFVSVCHQRAVFVCSLGAGPRAGSVCQPSNDGHLKPAIGLRLPTVAVGEVLMVETLKSRRDFLRLRGGQRCATPVCVIEAKPRQPASSVEASGARFGFTVTKKLGHAVRRNRIRRRLKAAIAELADDFALPGFDYVVVARNAAFDTPYHQLLGHIERALRRIRRAASQRQ